MALARLSQLDNAMFDSILPTVLRNPHDWQQFIDICRSKRIRSGVGRHVKTAIKNVLQTTTPYHVLKYTQAVTDMINIARPSVSINPEIVSYIKEGTTNDVLMRYQTFGEMSAKEQAAALISRLRLSIFLEAR